MPRRKRSAKAPIANAEDRIPRRKTRRIRRGSSVTVYLEFDLLNDIHSIAERDDMNFNAALRDLLRAATDALKS